MSSTTERRVRNSAIFLAVPLLFLFAGCGVPANAELGSGVRISDGTVTVTSIEEKSTEDVADLELDELEGQTPYFVEYEVQFNDGADSINENLWKAKASSGEATPLNIISIGGGFDCTGLGEVSGGKAKGCQLVMVPDGASLESVSFGNAGTWRTPGS